MFTMLTKQPKLTAIIQLCRLTLFGHIMRMDDNTDAKRILLASPTADWRRQLGRPRIMWLSNIQQDLKNTTLRSQKQQIWLRTALCGGWWRRMVLRNRELHARNDDDKYCINCRELTWRQNLEKSRRIICWVAVTGNQWCVHNIWRWEIVHDNIIIFIVRQCADAILI